MRRQGGCAHDLHRALRQPLDRDLVAKVLIPELRPGQTVILDNASFHRMTQLRTSLEPLGCTLLPLPPYSPDLNKIEGLWHRIKSFVRHDYTLDHDFHAKANAAFCSL